MHKCVCVNLQVLEVESMKHVETIRVLEVKLQQTKVQHSEELVHLKAQLDSMGADLEAKQARIVLLQADWSTGKANMDGSQCEIATLRKKNQEM